MPADKKCLLIGAGHAHVEVLRAFAKNPIAGTDLSLIAPAPRAPYTGMAPGLVAGRYAFEEASIDVAGLGAAAGARVHYTKAASLDRAGRRVVCENGEAIPYDVLSINVGAVTRPAFPVAADAPRLIPVKPAEPFIEVLTAFLVEAKSGQRRQKIVVIGGGLGGIELSSALTSALPEDAASVTLITGAAGLSAGVAPTSVQARIRRQLAAKRVTLIEGVDVAHAGAHAVTLSDGRTIPADLAVLAVGVTPSPFVAGLDLPKDEKGFLRVGPTLQSTGDPSIFAGGDCASVLSPHTGAPLPKAGVFAVREGPILAANIQAALTGAGAKTFTPQKEFLTIMTFAPEGALAMKGGFSAGGAMFGDLVDRWKTWIDRRFIARYNDLPTKQ